MTAWTSDELNKIAVADELQIAPVRRDGTLRNPVTIWVVRHGDDLYVRSVNGRTASGSVAHKTVTKRKSAPATSTRTYISSRPATSNDEIDAAYRTKYDRYAASIIDRVISPEARAATLKLVPRPPSS